MSLTVITYHKLNDKLNMLKSKKREKGKRQGDKCTLYSKITECMLSLAFGCPDLFSSLHFELVKSKVFSKKGVFMLFVWLNEMEFQIGFYTFQSGMQMHKVAEQNIATHSKKLFNV